MFGRIFGRGKDDHDQAVCAECGRTLLAGEWTQTIIDEHGDERLICSLCGQAYAGHSEPVAAAPAPANNGRVRETRSESAHEESLGPAPAAAAEAAAATQPAAAHEPQPAPARDARAESDAFWQALKDKDGQIEQLKAELARAEAERQELAGRFARLGNAEAPEPGSLTGDSSVPGERTWGETPAEFAAEMAALREAEQAQAFPAAPGPDVPAVTADVPTAPYEPLEAEPAERAQDAVPEETGVEEAAEDTAPAEAAASQSALAAETAGLAAEAGSASGSDVHPVVFEDTQPIPAVDEEMLAAAAADDDAASTGEIAAAEAAAAVAAAAGALPGEPAPAVEEPAPSAAEAEAAAASLTLLQRGVDLLNVSRVPRKIAETNEQLGLPHVHVGFDGEIVAITFMWSMGWYRFHVDLEGGDVTMRDRGYDELTSQPNAGVRADGTVQLAPAQISRAVAAQRTQAAPEAAPSPAAAAEQPAAAEPETPREAAQKAPEFLSKSLLGQRSDDESASWEQTTARDFDWDR
ncbi:MAG TPA: hypothetical protein VMH50_13555 [Thermoleophilia bacterium]|nr:hypothetical protein [Thermoleophilia bacterium]